MDDEVVFAQCRAVLENTERLVIDQNKTLIQLQAQITDLKNDVEHLRQEVRTRDAI